MVNTRIGGSQGSSTGAPGIPVSTQDPRSHYDPATTGYNPATGAAYAKPSAKSKATRSDRIWHTPNTVQRAKIEEATATSGTGDSSKSTMTELSESSRRKAKRIGASVQPLKKYLNRQVGNRLEICIRSLRPTLLPVSS
ncbi:Uncharacterized protein PECH_001101 [Penicillium ucsense]|uniref:Uncharacterized protein n=1 Tax=Penicillium ucsense TaxID=2839758 RepID=A0A8J8WL88_9EURO|nr:Uncharacterized protein PECM_002343 [Penicillium ucsense]KAF7738334.1 Uncharacterized protein PECH_001101 [Penicillium ucsense]